MNRIFLLPVVVLLVHASLLAHALEPANPHTNAKARAILNYLEKLPQQTEKRLVSGQFTSYGPVPTWPTARMRSTRLGTGRP